MKDFAQVVIDNCSWKIILPVDKRSKPKIKRNTFGVEIKHDSAKKTLSVIDVVKF